MHQQHHTSIKAKFVVFFFRIKEFVLLNGKERWKVEHIRQKL